MTTSALRRSLSLFVVALGLTIVPGCKQSLGDPCQVSSDCEDGLVCVLPVGGTPQVGGNCQPPDGFDMGSDAGVVIDTDLGPNLDASGTVDLATPNDDFSSVD